MRKINSIKQWDNVMYDKHIKLYGVNTVTKSRAIGNLADLISDIDLLTEVGYDEYLALKRGEFEHLESIIDDSMHIRNLFEMDDEDMAELTLEERTAYVRRADMKVEIQFIETNKPYLEQLSKILNKINKFNEVKNTRTYTPRVLTKYEALIKSQNN
ncbi:MAG: hypothetical protein ACRCX2_12290 [Paraclostridium sp.]